MRQQGRQRARRGAVRDALLVVLAERPMHGYELMSELEARSSGRWRPSPGSIYPALARLEKDGLLEATELDEKKVFSLTAYGREVSRTIELDGADPLPEWGRGPDDAHGALRALPPEIAGQARQLRRFGSPAQIEQGAALLEKVKQELYDLLADGPQATQPGRDDPKDSTEGGNT